MCGEPKQADISLKGTLIGDYSTNEMGDRSIPNL